LSTKKLSLHEITRDISGLEFSKAIKKLGYQAVRQKGSHLYMTTMQKGEHHIAIPLHDPLKIGTLSSILGDIAEHFGMSKEEVINDLF
jgi:predicted RNA binding protein YcfA (HicA-like mRNA interferase family)